MKVPKNKPANYKPTSKRIRRGWEKPNLMILGGGFRLTPLGQSVVVGNYVPSPVEGPALVAESPSSTAQVVRSTINGNSLVAVEQEGVCPSCDLAIVNLERRYDFKSRNCLGGGE